MKEKPLPFVYLWTILGDHPLFEKAFGIKNNVSTTLALSPTTLVQITKENVMTYDNLITFLDSDEDID